MPSPNAEGRKPGRPVGATRQKLDPRAEAWRQFLLAAFKERGLTVTDVAGHLEMSEQSLRSRIRLRTEWHPADLARLALLIGMDPTDVLIAYPDLREK